MHPLMTIAVRAARRAGEVIARAVPRLEDLKVEAKSRNDYVSEVDRAAEHEIVEIIHQAYPAHAILAEEGGASGEHEARWIIDPLDGTTNYLHGFPVFAVSIACEVRGRLEVAVVYDVMRQELFTATRGAGAQLDNRRIRVGKRRGLEGTLVSTGFPFRTEGELETYMAMLQAVIPKVGDVRRPGAASLDLAYVAAGRVDAHWEMSLAPWDTAAGALLVTEAGGHVSRVDGSPYEHGGSICAGNPRVHAALIACLAPLVTAPPRGVKSGGTLRARARKEPS